MLECDPAQGSVRLRENVSQESRPHCALVDGDCTLCLHMLRAYSVGRRLESMSCFRYVQKVLAPEM